eukprot:TRINITY_DN15069_c0_g1_i8.p1 TRINITY_DN15069_c0_g1~~TRINITY_DN15069_c0_g1_i8.p1  ORF type:complete len:275 (-),score=-36.47 TRINITY_DN15069_c0_g1_i8:237-1061(-)
MQAVRHLLCSVCLRNYWPIFYQCVKLYSNFLRINSFLSNSTRIQYPNKKFIKTRIYNKSYFGSFVLQLHILYIQLCLNQNVQNIHASILFVACIFTCFLQTMQILFTVNLVLVCKCVFIYDLPYDIFLYDMMCLYMISNTYVQVRCYVLYVSKIQYMFTNYMEQLFILQVLLLEKIMLHIKLIQFKNSFKLQEQNNILLSMYLGFDILIKQMSQFCHMLQFNNVIESKLANLNLRKSKYPYFQRRYSGQFISVHQDIWLYVYIQIFVFVFVDYW